MATAVINSALYVSGPGILWVADLSAADPALDTTVVVGGKYPTTAPTGFVPFGSTAKGFGFSDAIKTEDQMAAESYYPVFTATTGREATADVVAQEISKSTLLYALNAATSAAVTTGTTGTTATVITPAAPGQEVRRKWLWQSQNDDVRWLAYQALNIGSIDAKVDKGANAMQLTFKLKLELPPSQPVPYRIGLAGTVRNV